MLSFIKQVKTNWKCYDNAMIFKKNTKIDSKKKKKKFLIFIVNIYFLIFECEEDSI